MWSLLLVLLAVARAATPVALPPGEPTAPWVEPFALADLVAGAPGAGAGVVILEENGRWLVKVKDAAGLERVTHVAPPSTATAREDVAWLIASLLRPVGVRGAPVAPPTALPRPVVPPPVAVERPVSTPSGRAPSGDRAAPARGASGASETLPEPEPAVVEVDPAPVGPVWPPADSAPAALTPMTPSGGAPSAAAAGADAARSVSRGGLPTAWTGLWGGVAARPGAAATGTVEGRGGVAFAGGWRLGGTVGMETPSALGGADSGRAITVGWAGLTGGWVGARRVAPEVAVEVGAALDHYTEDETIVADLVVPVAAGGAGVRVALTPALGVLADVRLRCALRGTTLVVPGEAEAGLWPCVPGIGVGLDLGVQSERSGR